MSGSAASWVAVDPSARLAFVVEALTRTTGRSGRQQGRNWQVCCPAHDDKTPSLSVSSGTDGRVLVHCHAGCHVEDVVAAAGLELADLMPEKVDDWKPAVARPAAREVPLAGPSKGKHVYVYTDEAGEPLYRVERTDMPGGKKVTQSRPVHGGWTPGLGNAPMVPYQLPRLLAGIAAGAPVWIVEGEKCADALNDLGLIATTNSGGAGKWRPEWAEMFTGATVHVLPDNDKPGRDHALVVKAALEPVATVRVHHLPGLPDKGDVYDWLAAGYTKEDLLALTSAPATTTTVPAPVRPETTHPWPNPSPDCFYGLAGSYAQEITDASEADPMAVLMSVLTGFGAMCGRNPHIYIGNTRHGASLFTLVVGESSRARKGTSWHDAAVLLELLDDSFLHGRGNVLSGVGSGEGLVHAMRDPSDDNTFLEAGAILDRRFLLLETEFAGLLKVAGRDQNTTSPILRQAWDGMTLRTTTKSAPETAKNYHLGIIGHITIKELRSELTTTEAANGFANRHIFIGAKRTKLISNPPRFDDERRYWYASVIRPHLDQAQQLTEVPWTPEAAELWDDIYRQVETRDLGDGLALDIASRGAPQIRRLALIQALLNGHTTIDTEHLITAHAIWTYAEETVLHVYGDRLGNPTADKILTAVRDAGTSGLTGTQVSALFHRNIDKDTITDAVDLLCRKGLAHKVSITRDGPGRPTTLLLPAGVQPA